jgi:hypothetical protein
MTSVGGGTGRVLRVPRDDAIAWVDAVLAAMDAEDVQHLPDGKFEFGVDGALYRAVVTEVEGEESSRLAVTLKWVNRGANLAEVRAAVGTLVTQGVESGTPVERAPQWIAGVQSGEIVLAGQPTNGRPATNAIQRQAPGISGDEIVAAFRVLGMAGSVLAVLVALFVLDGGTAWLVGGLALLTFVISNPAMALNCPHCGRWVAAFSTTCGHCGRSIR